MTQKKESISGDELSVTDKEVLDNDELDVDEASGNGLLVFVEIGEMLIMVLEMKMYNVVNWVCRKFGQVTENYMR